MKKGFKLGAKNTEGMSGIERVTRLVNQDKCNYSRLQTYEN